MNPVLPEGIDSSVLQTREDEGYGLRLGGPHWSMRGLFSLNGRTIIVTGGAGSIGANIAHAILQSGADVWCLDRAMVAPKEVNDALEKVAESHGTRYNYLSCDITNIRAVEDTIEQIKKLRRHAIRGLVACAGIALNQSAFENDFEDSLNVYNVNINGTFACAQVVAKAISNDYAPGSIVFIASMSAWGANKGLDTAAYNSSKAAVVQLGRSLAAEWGSREGQPQIRVNTISPGYVKTALTVGDMQIAGREQNWASQNMLNRLSYPDEYRGPAVFLLSDASSFMTGADLRVDGGHTAW